MNLLWGTFSDLEGWLHGGRQENVTNSSYTNNLHHQLVSPDSIADSDASAASNGGKKELIHYLH